MPWTGFSNNPNGTVRPCCIYRENIKDDDGNDVYVQEKTVKEIFQSPYMKDVRQKFREGKKPVECATCWEDEKHGRQSKRLIYNEQVSQELDIVDWREEPELPIEYQMIISNSCNLKCRSCTPSHSSQWQIEHRKYHHGFSGYDMPHGQAGDEQSILWKDRHSWYPHLKRLEVVGGEPMYIKQWHQMFDELIELGYAKDIILDMSTNCNILLQDKLAYWAENFKRVGVGLSIDGTGLVYDYMRKLGKWEVVYENMKKYHDMAKYYATIEHDGWNEPCQLFVQVSFTLSWLNALELPKIHKLVEEEFPYFKIWNNLVHFPEWMTLRYAPNELKEYILQDWRKRDWKQYTQDIEGFISYMQQPTVDENTFKHFLSKNIFLDKFRNEKLFDVVPEYEQFLSKYVTETDEPYSPNSSIPVVILK